jgi:hypothetical protein
LAALHAGPTRIQEFEMLHSIEDGICRPGVEHYEAPVSLQAGPKWIARVSAAVENRKRWFDDPLPLAAKEQLLKLEPVNAVLKHISEHGDGYIATTDADGAGLYRGYATISVDRTIEMGGVLGVGVWGDAERSWWPGVYEVPMLKMLSNSLRSMLDLLMQGTTPELVMTLTDIDGTAILAEHEGMERPFRLPRGVNRLQFCPVRLDDAPSCRSALTASFGRVRELVGIGNDKPFYL